MTPQVRLVRGWSEEDEDARLTTTAGLTRHQRFVDLRVA